MKNSIIFLICIIFLSSCGNDDDKSSLLSSASLDTSVYNDEIEDSSEKEITSIEEIALNEKIEEKNNEKSIIEEIKNKFKRNEEVDKKEEISLEENSSPIIQITAPTGNFEYNTASTRVVLWGEIISDSNIHKIKVNDYVLTKYKNGHRKFSFIADKKLGTLKRGSNTYVITAYDKEENEVYSTFYTINSEVGYSKLSNTGFSSIAYCFIISLITLLIFRRMKLV